MTPNIAIIQVSNPYWRSFRLWIPLFVLWIPAVLLAPLLLLVLLIACLLVHVNFRHTLSVSWGILTSLPGTHVRVLSEANQVLVEIR